MSDPNPPTPPTTKALSSQVGGHPGVLSAGDGSLIIKPCLVSEARFYDNLGSNPDYIPLLPYAPKFYGTLKLIGETKAANGPNEGKAAIDLDEIVKDLANKPSSSSAESLVLENLSYTFIKPNILDVKLGQILYDEGASEDKKARMIQTAKNTTSFESGIRLTGFQVYDSVTDTVIATPKAYGKSIKVSDLPTGVAKFFPCPSAPLASDTPSPKGLPSSLLIPILKGLIKEVKDIESAFSKMEMRMVGGSLLIIYEGDEVVAKAGLEKLESAADEEDEDEDEDEDEEEEDSSGESGDDVKERKIGSPYLVKLIDFAHTKVQAGLGPDEGVLLGMRNVVSLFEGRLKEVEAAAS